MPNSERLFCVYNRHLHLTINPQDKKFSLADQSHNVISVTNIIKCFSKLKMPLKSHR